MSGMVGKRQISLRQLCLAIFFLSVGLAIFRYSLLYALWLAANE
jgi:hypothetical protein